MDLLFHVLDGALGTTSKIRLLRALISLGRPVTGREAARLAAVSQTAAVRALDDLVALGLLARKVEPSGHRYTANRENVLIQRALPALFRAEEERARSIVEALREALAPFTPSIAGSTVRRRVRAAAVLTSSPPDAGGDRVLTVLVVVASAKDVNAVADELAVPTPRLETRFGLRFAPVVLPLDRFRSRYDAGDPLIHTAVEDSVPVTGDPLETLTG